MEISYATMCFKLLFFVFGSIIISESSNYCDINLTIDLPLFEHLQYNLANVTELVKENVKELNQIYSDSVFSEYGLVFQVVNITVQDVCGKNEKCNKIGYLLGLFTNISQPHAQDYCLNFLMTYRDFPGGVVGLAWRGYVCSHKPSPKDKHLNIGVISKLNYGRSQSTVYMGETLAHEIGHTFGAPHDDDATDEECRANPGLMGSAGGANHLSRCSIDCIRETIESIFNSRKNRANECRFRRQIDRNGRQILHERLYSNCFSKIKKPLPPFPIIVGENSFKSILLASILVLLGFFLLLACCLYARSPTGKETMERLSARSGFGDAMGRLSTSTSLTMTQLSVRSKDKIGWMSYKVGDNVTRMSARAGDTLSRASTKTGYAVKDVTEKTGDALLKTGDALHRVIPDTEGSISRISAKSATSISRLSAKGRDNFGRLSARGRENVHWRANRKGSEDKNIEDDNSIEKPHNITKDQITLVHNIPLVNKDIYRKNLRDIMILVKKLSIEDITLEDSDLFEYFPRPVEEEWKTDFLKLMIVERELGNFEESDHEFMDFLCSN